MQFCFKFGWGGKNGNDIFFVSERVVSVVRVVMNLGV